MEYLSRIDALTTAVLGVAAVLGIAGGWYRWVRPRWRNFKGDVVGMRDAVLGRPEYRDSITGQVRVPALPGIGVRMAHQEQQMDLLTETVAQLVDQRNSLLNLQEQVNDHAERLQTLEDAAMERMVTRAESAQAWKAMEAAWSANPTRDSPPDDPDSEIES